jgi:hypothetical protein
MSIVCVCTFIYVHIVDCCTCPEHALMGICFEYFYLMRNKLTLG